MKIWHFKQFTLLYLLLTDCLTHSYLFISIFCQHFYIFSFPHVKHHFIICHIYTECYLTIYFLALFFVLYFTFIALILCFITYAHYHNIYLNLNNFYQFPDLRIIRKLFIFHLICLIIIYIYMMGFNPLRHFIYASLGKCLYFLFLNFRIHLSKCTNHLTMIILNLYTK